MASQSDQQPPPQSIHDFTVKDAKGNDVNLGDYKGKVLLIVNVAKQCGLTNSNYTELTKLYQKYKDQGCVYGCGSLFGVCKTNHKEHNQIQHFRVSQGWRSLHFRATSLVHKSPEPTKEEIENFVCTRFKAEYPIFDKVDVNGSKAAPIYKYLKSAKGGLFGDSIKWNFSKFLVDKDGKVVDRYAPTTSPLNIEKDIKKLIEKASL